jgi:hypothetical protein
MSVDHERARRLADGWASAPADHYPPAGELARAYLDVLARRAAEEPHHRALREMRASNLREQLR